MNGQIEMYPASAEAYAAFEDKFKSKKTTDDCYTPAPVYAAVAAWVADRYGLDAARFVRPFWPDGDFMSVNYAPDAVVVDNPPFSLLSVILRWYSARGIRFFLFAPALTLFTAPELPLCYLPCGVRVAYENGATVPTSFVTNLDDARVRVAPDLYCAVDAANDAAIAARKAENGAAELPKYAYPDEVITAAICQHWAKYGVPFAVSPEDCFYTGALDAQRRHGKAIFGGGFLLKPRAAAERADAERAAAERAAAERAAAERAAAIKWALSPRERALLGMDAAPALDQPSLFDGQ